MGYQVLYRQYRSTNFAEVVGQDYIIKTLVNAIKRNKIAHAYLFAGPRGTGKTSVAKLFAKAINCENFKEESCNECASCKAYLENNHPDIIEMDAASNNSVEDIRNIVEQVSYAPMLGKYKVYIIDEVHMLSTSAFNALLKTLEEPPAHVVFILATTDPQKVIPTVLSRCQRYNFSKISTYDIKRRMIDILNKENIKFEEKAVELLARLAEGGMRDALSLLEQCLSYNDEELKLEDVEHIFGLTSTAEEVELYTKIHQCEISDVVESVRAMYQRGMDTKRLASDLLDIIKEALIYSDKANEKLLSKLTPVEAQNVLRLINVEGLLNDCSYLEDVLTKEKQNQNFLVYFELCLIKMANNKTGLINKQTTKQQTKQVEESTIISNQEEIEEEQLDNAVQEIETSKDPDFLLKLLLDANRDLKIADQIIYNKLDLYMYEADKRKFYQLLIGTDLFASNKDAIIVVGNKSQVNNINLLKNNKDLYFFINEEFGVDKMIYAITKEEKDDLVARYKATPISERNKPVYVEKYKIEKRQTKEEHLKDLFGDALKVEE